MRSKENRRDPQSCPVSLSQNDTKITKINRQWTKSKQSWKWSGYFNMIFQAIPPLRSQENAPKSLIKPVSLNQNATKMRKISKRRPKSNQCWRWSGYISMSNFRPLNVTAIKTQVRDQPYLSCYHKHQVNRHNWISLPQLQICSFGKTRYICLVCHLEVSSWKIENGCNEKSDDDSALISKLHRHKTKSKLHILKCC